MAHAGQFCHGEKRRTELVTTGYATAVVSVVVKDAVVQVALWHNVGPANAAGHDGTQPIGVTGSVGQEQPIPERAGQRGPGGFLGEHRVGRGGLRLHPEPFAHDLKRPTRPRLRRPTNFRQSRAKKKGPIAYREQQ